MKSPRAFTLIELLVTISIIALLIALLLPGLTRGRDLSVMADCMTGERQLSIGYFSYSNDNDYRLMFGQPANRIDAFVYPNAGEQPIRKGALFPYVQVVSYYQCPADPNGNERSYSLPGVLHGEGWETDPRTMGTDTLIDVVNPAAQIVWFEESDNRGYNIGSWIMDCRRSNPYKWIDYVGLFHLNQTSDNFGFLDGHVETRTWEDQRVVDNALRAQDTGSGGFGARFMDSPDWDWVRPRYRQLQTKGECEYLRI